MLNDSEPWQNLSIYILRLIIIVYIFNETDGYLSCTWNVIASNKNQTFIFRENSIDTIVHAKRQQKEDQILVFEIRSKSIICLQISGGLIFLRHLNTSSLQVTVYRYTYIHDTPTW